MFPDKFKDAIFKKVRIMSFGSDLKEGLANFANVCSEIELAMMAQNAGFE